MKFSLFKAWSRSKYSYACFSDCQEGFHSSVWYCLPSPFTMFSKIVSPFSCNRVYCIHVSGHDPLTFLSGLFPFCLDGSSMAQLSKVLKLVRWPGSVPFPPVSLQWQVVCCCGRCSCVHLRGEPTLFPVWCANKKLCYSNLWLVTLHPCFQPASVFTFHLFTTKKSMNRRVLFCRSLHKYWCWLCLLLIVLCLELWAALFSFLFYF